MGKITRIFHKRPIFLVVLLLIALYYLFFDNRSRIFRFFKNNNYVRTYTSLRYCSDSNDAQCQPGVTTVQYRIKTRAVGRRDLFKFDKDTRARIRLQEITLRFRERSQDLYDTTFFIYSDVDKNGQFDKDIDRKIARGLLRKKRLLFEDLNQIFDYKEFPPKKGLDEIAYFFIVPEDTDQTFNKETLKRIEVYAQNIERGNEEVVNWSSFADKSVYKYGNLISISKEEFLARYPIFVDAGGSNIRLLEGIYEIRETIVIPKNLNINFDAGVYLKMGEGVSLVSYSPVFLRGTSENPIRFTKLGSAPWGAFGVIGEMDGTQTSNLSYTEFDSGFEDTINGAYLSGMVSIYRGASVTVDHCVFKGANADDALNIKYLNAILHNNLFEANSADAFDGDFVTGKVFSNVFLSNGNDALDFSGSRVDIYRNYIESSGDKGVSVGEATEINIVNNMIRDSNIGVQVKDSSRANVYNNFFKGNQVAFDAYVKKDIFKEPVLEYYNNYLVENVENISNLVDKGMLEQNFVNVSEGLWTTDFPTKGTLIDE